MAVVVEKLLNEPIIVLKADAQVTQQELSDAWFQCVELAQSISGSAYQVVDLRSNTVPATVVSWLRDIVKAMVGAPVTPLLRVSFIGTSAAAASVPNAQAETWFETLDEALSHIRTMAGVATMST